MAIVAAAAAPLSTAALRDEVLRLEEDIKLRHWQEQQLSISDGCVA